MVLFAPPFHRFSSVRLFSPTALTLTRHFSQTAMRHRTTEIIPNAERAPYVQAETPRSTVKRKIVLYVGYNGADYHGFQRNEGVPTISDKLEHALFEAGAISSDNLGSLSKVSWVVAARTDKGVSASGNAVSLKAAFPRAEKALNDESLNLDLRTLVENMNRALPPEVRVFGAAKPTKSFSAKDACSGRSYEYLLPLDALSPDCELLEYAEILSLYEGSHYFHNFTVGKEHKVSPPPQASRYITLCTCSSNPISLDESGRKFVRIQVSGQSFMLHQIRKMVSLSIMVQRKMVSSDAITLAFDKNVLANIAPAPACGLFLDGLLYDAYNQRFSEFLDSPIDVNSCKREKDAFKFDVILPTIARLFAKEEALNVYFQTIKNHLPQFDSCC